MTELVRGLLITPDGDLLTIRRTRPGQEPYWVLPGGGVEVGEDLETALVRDVLGALRRQASRYRREPLSVVALLAILGSPGSGMPGFRLACRQVL